MKSSLVERRVALGRLLVGAGIVGTTQIVLPENWTRPVVESVLLPAHAQTTGAPDPGPDPTFQYTFACFISSIIPDENTEDPDDFIIGFTYTPVDNSGALNGQPVDTVYTATDANDTVVFGPQEIFNTMFGTEAGVSFGVTGTAPFTVTVMYLEPGTFGSFSCASSISPP